MKTGHARILAMDPGSTSTKVGLFEDDKLVYTSSVSHSVEELAQYPTALDQKDLRVKGVLELLARNSIDLKSIDAVIGRGGIVKPLPAGTFIVNDAMISDLRRSSHDHASNVGALMALAIAEQIGVPAYIADPVCVDEFEDVARISGLKELERPTLSHALNTRATLFKYAASVGKDISQLNVVVGHLGGGISITAVKGGRMVDTSGAMDGGPFSPERSGALPTTLLIKFCFRSGMNEKQVLDYTTKKGGLVSYLGTNDLRKAKEMVSSGNAEATLVFHAMCYQIGKEIGAMAAALKGTAEAILLTGGMANDQDLVAEVTEYVSWIAPIKVYPGEGELEALAAAALRVLRGQDKPKEYVS